MSKLHILKTIVLKWLLIFDQRGSHLQVFQTISKKKKVCDGRKLVKSY